MASSSKSGTQYGHFGQESHLPRPRSFPTTVPRAIPLVLSHPLSCPAPPKTKEANTCDASPPPSPINTQGTPPSIWKPPSGTRIRRAPPPSHSVCSTPSPVDPKENPRKRKRKPHGSRITHPPHTLTPSSVPTALPLSLPFGNRIPFLSTVHPPTHPPRKCQPWAQELKN